VPQHGMDLARFVDVLIKSLEFRTTLITLLLGAYGFAIGRMWPEGEGLFPKRILRLLPGAIACIAALVILNREYRLLASAISQDKVLVYATEWATRLQWFDVSIAFGTFALFGAISMRSRRPQHDTTIPPGPH